MLKEIISNLPEVSPPLEKRLPFKTKLKWTLTILIAFFVLANIPLYGLGRNALERFEFLAIIFGTDFGSIISLGIGPIVMASIVLQLLVGSKLLNIDLTTKEGKKYFQGLQKILTIFFIIFEAMVYVLMKGLEAMPGYTFVVIFQLFIGGVLIMLMDEVVSKWGFGSGVSLFIAAGVGWRLFTGIFGIATPAGGIAPFDKWPGKIWVLITGMSAGLVKESFVAAASLVFTAGIFFAVVWAQSIKVEVPLGFERVRGYTIRWPLSFFYTSVIPIILTAALLANIQLFASLAQNSAMACEAAENCGLGGIIATKLSHVLGKFTFEGVPESGLVFWLSSLNLVEIFARQEFKIVFLLKALFHILFFVFFSIIFAIFWVRTSGMDASSQAHNILASGLQIPGFRRDERVLEAVLSRYIMPLTVMGAAAIGLLSSMADILGALVSGTAILLAVMITYNFYQEIAQQHALDIHPALKKFIK